MSVKNEIQKSTNPEMVQVQIYQILYIQGALHNMNLGTWAPIAIHMKVAMAISNIPTRIPGTIIGLHLFSVAIPAAVVGPPIFVLDWCKKQKLYLHHIPYSLVKKHINIVTHVLIIINTHVSTCSQHLKEDLFFIVTVTLVFGIW